MSPAPKTPESEKPATLLTALLAAKAELPVAIAKDKTNPAFRSKYVSLDAIMETVTPILTKHDLVWVTVPGGSHDAPTLVYSLRHAGGESIEGAMPLLLGKTDMQGLGSATTYARRYAIMAVLGLTADEDDDGNKAAESARSASQAAQQTNGRGPRPLSEPNRQKVLDAIRSDGRDPAALLEAVGLEDAHDMTAEHARRIRELMDTDLPWVG